MRLYVELVNQRYDDAGGALGAFKASEWKTLLERLAKARENCGTTTEAKGTSFEDGVGRKSPSSVVLLLDAEDPEDAAPLIQLRDEVQAKGGLFRLLVTSDVSPHVEAIANTLSGEHGFEKRGVHFACVAGDECGLKVYDGDPGYHELMQKQAEVVRAKGV